MIKRLVSVCAFLICLSTPALAQSPSIEFNFLKIEGFSIGTRFLLNDAFEEKAGRPIPARLEMIIPTAKKKYQVLIDNQPSGGLVKISFATFDQVLIDSIHIIDATIPMQAMDKRLAQFAGLLKDNVFPQSVQGMGDPKLIALRNYQMERYASVELVGSYIDPDLGKMYLRILGVPHPDKAESIFIISNINAQYEPLTGVEQFPKTLSGRTVDTIKFTK